MGVKMSRKGYVHALEGVIAALLVVVYLNTIVSAPSTTDWETAEISKQSEDLLSALDRSGFLDQVILRGDSASFNALVNRLEGSMSYSVQVSGLPKRFLDVGVMANNSSTYRVDTQPGDWGGTGLPDSEDGRYRQGNLDSHPEFGDVRFVLSDTVENDIHAFSAVNFDFDSNGDFGSSEEGPFNFSDRFTCDSSVDGCSGSQTYEVGSFNATLTLYNASTAASLEEKKSETSIGGRTVDITYETVNPFHGSLERFDVLWVEDWPASELEDYEAVMEDFIRPGRMIIIHSLVEKEGIDGNYLSELGFDYISEYRVSGTGATRNIFYSLHGPRNQSYRSTQYYLEGGIRLEDFSDEGGYDESVLEIQGSEVSVRRWPDGDVSFGSESFRINHSVGDPVSVEGNMYYIEESEPLVLDPSGQQGFESFETERINADYHATRMEGRRYNITEYDTSAEFTEGERYQNLSDIPGDYGDGLVETEGVCDWRDYPYKNGSITIDGTDYAFMLVNFEPGGDIDCDQYSEFVYFDMARDGDFDDDTLSDSSREGPYQRGGVVNVSGNRYTVSPHLDGNGTDLQRVGPRLVGEIPVSRDVFGKGGSSAVIGRQGLGHDDMHLVASVMARETQEKQPFTAPRSLGDNSLGYTYTSSVGKENSFGYTIQSVWWFQ